MICNQQRKPTIEWLKVYRLQVYRLESLRWFQYKACKGNIISGTKDAAFK
jgi:hypothetical protein